MIEFASFNLKINMLDDQFTFLAYKTLKITIIMNQMKEIPIQIATVITHYT